MVVFVREIKFGVKDILEVSLEKLLLPVDSVLHSELIELVETHSIEGEMFKFCGTVNDHQDALQIVEACHELRGSKHNFSMMALGNGGDWARLHAPVLGQSLVYATLRSEFKLSNKGLVNIKDLKSAWTLMEY